MDVKENVPKSIVFIIKPIVFLSRRCGRRRSCLSSLTIPIRPTITHPLSSVSVFLALAVQ